MTLCQAPGSRVSSDLCRIRQLRGVRAPNSRCRFSDKPSSRVGPDPVDTGQMRLTATRSIGRPVPACAFVLVPRLQTGNWLGSVLRQGRPDDSGGTGRVHPREGTGGASPTQGLPATYGLFDARCRSSLLPRPPTFGRGRASALLLMTWCHSAVLSGSPCTNAAHAAHSAVMEAMV